MKPFPALWAVALSVLCGAIPGNSAGQEAVQRLGLEGQDPTSVSLYGSIIAVGTDRNGVYWQSDVPPTDSGWIHIPLDTLSVQTVYAHKSGPIGWAISAGVTPDELGTPFIYCSFMGGAFEEKSHGIADSLTTRVSSMAGFRDPSICGETYAAGDRALYRRAWLDTTWHPVYEATVEGNIATVIAKDGYPGVVLAGGADGFAGHLLIKSTDFGETWTNISPLAAVNDIDFAGEKAEVIFAATFGHVYRSLDGGATWQAMLDGLGAMLFTHVLYDPDAKRVYAAARLHDGSARLYFSLDNGDSWSVYALSVTGTIESFELERGGDWIYFVTREGGAYRLQTKLITVAVEGNETRDPSPNLVLDQNFPNPASASTSISYTIATPSRVILEVHDLLGRRIASWTNEHPSAGRYIVSLDASEFAPGVYVYRARTPQASQARSLVVW